MRRRSATATVRVRSAACVILSLTVPCRRLRSRVLWRARGVPCLSCRTPRYASVARRCVGSSSARLVRTTPCRGSYAPVARRGSTRGPRESFVFVWTCRRGSASRGHVLPEVHTTLLACRPPLSPCGQHFVTLRNVGFPWWAASPGRLPVLDAAATCHTSFATWQAASDPRGLHVGSDPIRLKRYWPASRATLGAISLAGGGLAVTCALSGSPSLRRASVACGGVLQRSPCRAAITPQ